ncbi:MAG: DNA repair protein RecN [Acidobacteriota bacterium]
MLTDLHVRNLAVVEESFVEFGAGLNVLTGETGAGKSLVVDSLALLAGARASSDLIREGADRLVVSGSFSLEGDELDAVRDLLDDAGLALEDPHLVVRREVARSGRNRVFLNDQPVTLTLLQRLGESLLRILGQREELALLSGELQRDWLDRAGGNAKPLAACAKAYREYVEARERWELVVGDDRARAERIDLLRFQSQEIDDAGVEAGEEVALRQRRDTLRNAETVARALNGAVEALDGEQGSALGLARAVGQLRELESFDSEAPGWVEEAQELRVRSEDLAATLRSRLDTIEAQPGELDTIEDRLVILERLLRKYGDTTEDILEHAERVGRELLELDADESRRDELEAEVESALAKYRDASEALTRHRRRWAKKLERELQAQLADLALPSAQFAVALEVRRREESPLEVGGVPAEFGAHGVDRVVYQFSPNPGEGLRPLARIASGGELARVFLALQIALRGEGRAERATLVFDEVDAGIGGHEATAVGRKLRQLASGGQLLAVTHLPQVASCSHRHFKVRKGTAKGRTRVAVEGLSDHERVEEVARMLGATSSGVSKEHAQELIESAAKVGG